MNSIQDLRVFTEIVRENSFAAAANKLGLSPATTSGRLKALEEYYGLCLLNRTTRSLSLTEEGRFLFESSVALIEDFEALNAKMIECKSGISGTISISTPTEFGRSQIMPLINEFAETNADVDFKVIFEDDASLRSIDDCEIMIRFGALPDCSLTTRKLTSNPVITCAAPGYLSKTGAPRDIADLDRHNCVRLTQDGIAARPWQFQGAQGVVSKRVQGNRIVSETGALLDLARAGIGIVQTTLWDAADDLEAGRLVTVLDDHRAPAQPVSLISESRDKLPKRTIAFIDFLIENLREYGGAILNEPDRRLRLVKG